MRVTIYDTLINRRGKLFHKFYLEENIFLAKTIE